MSVNLFPVYNLPDIPDEQGGRKYRASVMFDFETGDFVRDESNRLVTAAGREAYMQWCIKAVMTEVGVFLAYSTRYGAELERLHRDSNPETWKSDIQRTITDALMANPATEYVRDFAFNAVADTCHVSFLVKGRGWEEEPLSVPVQTG